MMVLRRVHVNIHRIGVHVHMDINARTVRRQITAVRGRVSCVQAGSEFSRVEKIVMVGAADARRVMALCVI